MIFNSSNPELITLSDLPQGESAVLGELHVAPGIAEHLMNLGFIPGTEITASQSGPGGDPRIYRVDRTEVALRRDLAAQIAVQPLPADRLATSADIRDAGILLQTNRVSAD